MRIVSLVPSLTELLIYINADVVGRTKFCIHPAADVKDIPKIGGTKTIHVDRVLALSPDLIIANKEENNKADIEALISSGLRVLVTDIKDIDSAVDAIRTIGEVTNRTLEADILAVAIDQQFHKLAYADGRSVCYLIWRKPYMTIGHDTYIHSMLTRAGYSNLYADRDRYPEVNIEELARRAPELIFLSSEPYPFAEKHISELQAACPESKVVLVDGEIFSWYGSRMLAAPLYLNTLLKSIGQRES